MTHSAGELGEYFAGAKDQKEKIIATINKLRDAVRMQEEALVDLESIVQGTDLVVLPELFRQAKVQEALELKTYETAPPSPCGSTTSSTSTAEYRPSTRTKPRVTGKRFYLCSKCCCKRIGNRESYTTHQARCKGKHHPFSKMY